MWGPGVQGGDDFEELKRAALDDVAVSQRTFKYPITTGDQQVCMRSMRLPYDIAGRKSSRKAAGARCRGT